MLKINGKFNTAEVFTNEVESTAISQILDLCNLKIFGDSRIRIMPDVHAGAGCTIGTTMTIKDKVAPNLVGVDISCGMLVYKINKSVDIDLDKLDKVIHENIPSGYDIRTSRHKLSKSIKFRDVKAEFDLDRAQFSVGTLGGGNHFIEVDVDENGDHYIVIHSGSRHFGKQVADYYQKLAISKCKKLHDDSIKSIIEKAKSEGKSDQIQDLINEFKSKNQSVPDALAWVEGSDFNDYMNDMLICQDFANKSRYVMMEEILVGMGISPDSIDQAFETLHNYIDFTHGCITGDYILRKGAIALYESELAIIPMNMRDGSLIVKGKGNPDWNWSGPHGAGRIMSRGKAKELIDLDEYKDSMKGIYSTCINLSTIDESPMAYKPMEAITSNIGDTCDIVSVIKPIYNFKAGE